LERSDPKCCLKQLCAGNSSRERKRRSMVKGSRKVLKTKEKKKRIEKRKKGENVEKVESERTSRG